jgi:hypothetical protein
VSSESATPKNTKGFSGLDSFVSDVSSDLKAAAEQRPTAEKALTGAAPKSELPPLSAGPRTPSPSGSGHGKTWGLIGAGALVLFLVWGYSSSNNPTTSSPPSPSTAFAPTAPPPSSFSTSPSHSSPARTSMPAPPAPAVPARPEFERPPVGQDLVLSVSQIRYCVREEIRLDALRSVLDSGNNYEIDRFNALIDDYNSRCVRFRYRKGDVERVQRELEPLRSSIASAAISEWRR